MAPTGTPTSACWLVFCTTVKVRVSDELSSKPSAAVILAAVWFVERAFDLSWFG